MVIGGLCSILLAVVSYMLKSALQRIGILETKVSSKVSEDRFDRNFERLTESSDDKFNNLIKTIQDTNQILSTNIQNNADRLETKIDRLSDNLTAHIREAHG